MVIIIALIFFSIIVLIHEFGHFIMAKACGVYVDEFSLGMGPKLFSIKGKETMYSIRLLPIGGYVKMMGEEEEFSDERSFSNKPVFQRMLIIIAGPVMNFLLTLVIFAGIHFYVGSPSNIIQEVIPNFPAQEVGLKENDKIVKVNQKKVSKWEDTSKMIEKSSNKEISITIERNNKQEILKLTPKSVDGKTMIGIVPKRSRNLIESSVKSIKMTGDFLIQMSSMFTGKVKIEDVSGPVGIVKVIGDTAQKGLINLVYLSGIISLNLGFLNLIPIPALDGGRFLFLLVEAIRGKKVNQEKEAMVNLVGFAVLMLLMIVVTVHDVVKF